MMFGYNVSSFSGDGNHRFPGKDCESAWKVHLADRPWIFDRKLNVSDRSSVHTSTPNELYKASCIVSRTWNFINRIVVYNELLSKDCAEGLGFMSAPLG